MYTHEGVVLNYRRGPRSQRNRECLIKVLDIAPEEASSLIGWKVSWPAEAPRLTGKISKTHGKTGALRVRFKKGLPGQALTSKVRITRE